MLFYRSLASHPPNNFAVVQKHAKLIVHCQNAQSTQVNNSFAKLASSKEDENINKHIYEAGGKSTKRGNYMSIMFVSAAETQNSSSFGRD